MDLEALGGFQKLVGQLTLYPNRPEEPHDGLVCHDRAYLVDNRC